MTEDMASSVVINGPEEESLRFFTWSWEDLLEWATINEYIKKGTPIPFRFKREFFFWKDIERIIRYFDSNAKITRIMLKTKYSEYVLKSLDEYLRLSELHRDVLHEFELSTCNPWIKIEMCKTTISADIIEDVSDAMMRDISNMLNKSRRPNAWLSFGGTLWVLE